MNLCPTCGANLDLVGRVHRCVPRVEVGRSREGKPVYRVELPRVDSPPPTSGNERGGNETGSGGSLRPRHRPYPLRRPPTTLFGGRAWLGLIS